MTPAERQARYLAQKEAARTARDYRSFVGPPDKYDVVAANQFAFLYLLGLREHHYVLDVGCGSLRAGRLLIPYLLPGRYFGVEPEAWLIDAGLRGELGQDVLEVKRPVLTVDSGFAFQRLGRQFDFILIHSIFTHASADQVVQCLAESRKVLNRGGIVAATFLPGSANDTGYRWAYTANHTWPRIRRFALEQGLVCLPVRWPHPTGQTWCVLLEIGNEAGATACRRLAAWVESRDQPRTELHGEDGPRRPGWRSVRAVLGRWIRSRSRPGPPC